MNKRSVVICLFGILAIALTGCYITSKPGKREYFYDHFGLDFDIHQPIYLKRNLYYNDPTKAVDINICSGKHIIPFGTKILILKAAPGHVIFTPEHGSPYIFKIDNDIEKSLLPDEIFFHNIFCQYNPIIKLKGMSRDDIEELKKGFVHVGMGREAVMCSYGIPPTELNPAYNIQTTWLYIAGPLYKIRYVVFNKSNKVIYIFDL